MSYIEVGAVTACPSAVGTITANGGTFAFNCEGYATTVIQLSGTWSGTVGVQVSADNGTTWTTVNAYTVSSTATAPTTSFTANGLLAVPTAGFNRVQVIATAWTSGTLVVNMIASAATLAKTQTAGRVQSLTTATLSVASTASTTTAGSSFSVPLRYDSMLVVGSLAAHTGGTLDVYLQDSPDGGTTWFDCAHFPQVSAAGTVKTAFSLSLSSTPVTIGIGTTGSPGVALAASSVRPAPWSTGTMRIVAVTGAGTSGGNQTQTIYFVPVNYAE
jgi:hypothetical protein